MHATLVERPSYGDGRNRGEAEAVVANIVHHHRRHPDKSLGVVAFTRRQAQTIERLLDGRRAEDPAVEALLAGQGAAEPLFVKSLEAVQGDERDVIFVSTTYGPGKAGGSIDQHFGPIGSEPGWRVLNVMASRARQRVEVFTSLQASDIHDEGAANRGVRALRGYLEYAAGQDQSIGAGSGRAPESDFELTVAQVIEKLGYRAVFEVSAGGFSIDLGVVNPDRPGEYLLGADCDGGPYQIATGGQERDRLRRELLENKGWTLHRIWSMGWYRTRQAEIDRLRQAIEECLRADRKRAGGQAGGEAEVLGTVPQATSQQIAQEEMEEQRSLAEALDRFWEKNIRPEFPGREDSILSNPVIERLVAARPLTVAGWETAVSAALREGMDPRQAVFLEDILGVIVDSA